MKRISTIDELNKMKKERMAAYAAEFNQLKKMEEERTAAFFAKFGSSCSPADPFNYQYVNYRHEDEEYFTQEDEDEDEASLTHDNEKEEDNALWTEKFSPKTLVWLRQFLPFLNRN